MEEPQILNEMEKKVSYLDRVFHEVIENANSLIVRWNERGINYMNHRALKYFGYTEPEVVGKSITMIMPEKGAGGEDMRGLSRDILEHPDKYVNMQVQNIKKDGEKVWVAWSNKVVKDENGETEIISIGNDIEAPMNKHQQDLARKEEKLAALSQLAGVIAHELRNPLASIQMASFNIGRKVKGEAKERIEGNLETIAKKVEESNKIISDVLAFGRIKPPSYQRVELSGLIKEGVASSHERLTDCKSPLEENLGGVEGLSVDVDPVQIKQVIGNLVNNACDAVRGIEGRQGRIDVEADADRRQVHIVVRDNGTGMDAETLKKLSKPFYTTKSTGTGLGLTVAKQIIQLHNGSISFQSAKGQGTSVTVSIPLQHA